MKKSQMLVFGTALLAASIAAAGETIAYTYDSRGRLVKVERKGATGSSVKAEYKYDKADNRIGVKVVLSGPPS